MVHPPVTKCSLRVELTPATPLQLTLTWGCGGTLQSAPDVTGPWSDFDGVTSPYVTAVGEARRYYRVRIP
jgi:hypothetical protein